MSLENLHRPNLEVIQCRELTTSLLIAPQINIVNAQVNNLQVNDINPNGDIVTMHNLNLDNTAAATTTNFGVAGAANAITVNFGTATVQANVNMNRANIIYPEDTFEDIPVLYNGAATVPPVEVNINLVKSGRIVTGTIVGPVTTTPAVLTASTFTIAANLAVGFRPVPGTVCTVAVQNAGVGSSGCLTYDNANNRFELSAAGNVNFTGTNGTVNGTGIAPGISFSYLTA